ncbi:MAG: hypothetical protein EOM50_12515 [Erysipelotrichia bacterium]|nr:hypothetical protein [Erysipelotrichia bacterium]
MAVRVGTDMGTKTDLERYLELWNLFDEEIRTSKKISPNSLAGFAKYWERYNDATEENDAKKVCDRLEKMRRRKNELTRVQKNSLLALEAYYKSLQENYFVQELLPDETYEHWFD